VFRQKHYSNNCQIRHSNWGSKHGRGRVGVCMVGLRTLTAHWRGGGACGLLLREEAALLQGRRKTTMHEIEEEISMAGRKGGPLSVSDSAVEGTNCMRNRLCKQRYPSTAGCCFVWYPSLPLSVWCLVCCLHLLAFGVYIFFYHT
jgi:hypothetical protein